MRKGLLALAVSLLLLPTAQAWTIEFVPGPVADAAAPLLDHGCYVVGVAGWPPQPRLDPDCISTSPSSPPSSDNSTASSSSPSNSTGDP